MRKAMIAGVVVHVAMGLGLAAGASRGEAGREPEWGVVSARFGGSRADTKPSRDATMAFTISVEIAEVAARGGARVSAGALLVRARDTDQVAVVDGQTILAENDNELQGATLAAELAELKYNRLMGSGTASRAESDELRIQHETAKVQVEQAKVRKSLEQVRLRQAKGQLDRYRLVAPFDGVVDEVKVEVGQGVRESEPALRVVDIQKLRVEPFPSTAETLRLGLKPGSAAWVLVDLADTPRLVRGTVIEVSAVADAVSQTRRVKVEFENAEGWPAGTQAMVRFTEPAPEWGKYAGETGRMSGTAGARGGGEEEGERR